MEQEFRGLITELYVSPHHPAGSENLLRAVVELDESNLNHEKLQNLIVLLPTSSELQMVKQYSGEHTALTLPYEDLYYPAREFVSAGGPLTCSFNNQKSCRIRPGDRPGQRGAVLRHRVPLPAPRAQGQGLHLQAALQGPGVHIKTSNMQ